MFELGWETDDILLPTSREAAEIARRRAAARRAELAAAPATSYYVGLDLGQLADYSALVVLRKTESATERTATGERVVDLVVGHIVRWPLGTSYPAIVRDVAAVLARPEIQPAPELVIDATGVGRPVVDMFRQEGLESALSAVSITGGQSWSYTGYRELNVAKVLLVSAAQAALSSGRLKIAKGLDHAETLKKELLDYRVKVTGSAHEVFEARQGAHDDLCMALAIPVWYCQYATYSAGAF